MTGEFGGRKTAFGPRVGGRGRELGRACRGRTAGKKNIIFRQQGGKERNRNKKVVVKCNRESGGSKVRKLCG